ncbi:hypothetical protein AAC387_Pa07g2493 [Persea americana]
MATTMARDGVIYTRHQRSKKVFFLNSLIGKGSDECVYRGLIKAGDIVAIKQASVGFQPLHDNSKFDKIEILSLL